jgi:hypothetical protein
MKEIEMERKTNKFPKIDNGFICLLVVKKFVLLKSLMFNSILSKNDQKNNLIKFFNLQEVL